MQIFVKTHTAQMEEYRRRLKEQAGDRYESLVAPYRSVLVMHCKEGKHDPYVMAEMLFRLAAQKRQQEGKRLEPHVRAALLSAAMDVEERKLLN